MVGTSPFEFDDVTSARAVMPVLPARFGLGRPPLGSSGQFRRGLRAGPVAGLCGYGTGCSAKSEPSVARWERYRASTGTAVSVRCTGCDRRQNRGPGWEDRIGPDGPRLGELQSRRNPRYRCVQWLPGSLRDKRVQATRATRVQEWMEAHTMVAWVG